MRATPSAAHSGTFQVTTPSDTEITLTRLFDAPRDLVWEAMTKPEHVRRWWGCLDERYSVPVCEIDLRVGGKWRFVGRGPEGDIPAFYGEYKEIDRPGPAGLHGDLRAVPGRRLAGDAAPRPRRAARPGSPSPRSTIRSQRATW